MDHRPECTGTGTVRAIYFRKWNGKVQELIRCGSICIDCGGVLVRMPEDTPNTLPPNDLSYHAGMS